MSWAKNLIENEETRKKLFPDVSNRTLLELGALHFAFFYDPYRESAQTIVKRLRAKNCCAISASIAGELEPEDIIKVIDCSKSKAKEYITLLRLFSV